MKKVIRLTAALLIASLLTGSAGSAGAVSFDTLDANTAVAGASVLLSGYCAVNDDVEEKLYCVLNPVTVVENEMESVAGESPEAPAEVLYEVPSVGIVSAATFLNIREQPSTESDIVGSVLKGAEITAVGEITVNGTLWFRVETENAKGYASGLFILFGEDAENYREELMESQEEENIEKPMPSTFALKNSTDGLPENTASSLRYYAQEVRYCLETAYPEAVASGNYTNTYSVLVYILEMYQKVIDISSEYGLKETLDQAVEDAAVVDEHRAKLCENTNQTAEDYEQEIRDAQRAAEPEESTEASTEAAPETSAEVRTEAPTESPAETQAPSYTPGDETVTEQGQAIVDFALQYVGWLPYVWGGASLTTGADCSGFCGQIYAHFGYLDQAKADAHAYDSYSLREVGYAVSVDSMQPGDMVCYQGHVAIYIGNGQIVHEPAVNRYCEIGSVTILDIITVRRLY